MIRQYGEREATKHQNCVIILIRIESNRMGLILKKNALTIRLPLTAIKLNCSTTISRRRRGRGKSTYGKINIKWVSDL